MAEQEQVSGIGLKLALDTSGFSAGIARAKSELAGLEATPIRVRAEVAVPREAIKVPIIPVLGIGRQELAGFRAQIEEGLRSTGGQINVGIKLTRINFGALRAEIAAGIGTVPIKVSIAGGGKASALNLVAATVAEQTGGESQSATAFVKNAAAKRGIPTRQYGGPVAPRRTVMVGESGPELAEFGGPVNIYPSHSSRMRGYAPGGRVFNPDLRRIAQQYNRSVGRPDPAQGVYHPLDPDFSRRTAVAYEAMPTMPNAASRASYAAFVRETAAQHRMLRAAGYGMTPNRIDPYQPTAGRTKMQLAAQDVRQNKNLNVFASYLEHPMMSKSEQLSFRFVHDLMGHLTEGNSIGPRGEYNAAIQHAQMYSPLARRAMLAETHGQNSVVNFSDTILPGQTRSIAAINADAPGSIYADQKARNLPAAILREFYAKAGIKRGTGGPVSRRYIIKDPDGIHGRPSQYLAGLMEGLDVHIAARNHGDRDKASFEGSGRSPMDWYGLNGRKGNGISIVATGDDAKRAHARISGILGFDPYKAMGKQHDPSEREAGFADFDPSIGAAYRRQFHHLNKLAFGGPVHMQDGGFFEIPAVAVPRREKKRSMANEGMTMASFLANASPEDKDFIDNLERAHTRLQAHHIAGGNAWYRDAGEYGRSIARRYGVDERTGVGVLAALSAGTEWEANKTKAEKILSAHAEGRPFPYSMNFDAHRKASAILSGQDPTSAFATSPKVGQFFDGLMGNLNTLTIDRWALRTATRGKLSQIGEGPVRTQIEQAWRQVAAKYKMAPAVSQAALWLLEKEESGQAPGQGAMGMADGGFAYSNQTSALNRLRQLTDESGRILPQHVEEAQDLNLQIERMRMAARTPVSSPWAQRMRESQGVAKEFGRGRGGPTTGQRGMFYQPGPKSKPYCTVCQHGILKPYEHQYSQEHQRNLRPIFRDKREGRSFYARMNQAFEGDLGSREQNAWAELRMQDPDFASLAARPAGGNMRSEDEARFMANGGEAFVPPWVRRMREQGLPARDTTGQGGGIGGQYIVNERGRELFVPKRLEGMIPGNVMSKLPKRGGGGIVEINQPPYSLFTPPEDGWIIPHHLKDQIPRMQDGGRSYTRDARGRFARQPSTYGVPVGQETRARVDRDDSFQPMGPYMAHEARQQTREMGIPEVGTTNYVPRSRRTPTATELASYLEGGPQLIQGRSSVRSAFAGISSYVLGGRQASAEARGKARADIGDLAELETQQRRAREKQEKYRVDEANAIERFEVAKARGPQRESATRFETRLGKLGEAVDKNTALHQKYSKEVVELTTKTKAQSEIAEQSAKKARVTAPNVAQNVASIALATTGYGLLTQGISAITSAATPAIAKLIDQMGGFKSSATATTTALADDTAARHGNAAAAIAGAAATAGLSAASLDFVDKALRPTVQVKAGGKAQGATSDLFRAAVGTGAPQGLYGGYGGLGGGAILGEFLGGGKGYTEQVAGDIAAFTQAKTPTRTFKDNWMTSGIPGVAQLGEALGGRTDAQILGAADRAPAALKATIDDQNAAMKRGAAYAVETASNLELTANVTDAIAAAYAATGDAAGDTKNSADMAAAHVALIDKATGLAVTSAEDYQKFWKQAATGKGIADPATVMRQLAQQMKATFAGIDARVARALTVTLPSQTAMGLISNPLVAGANVLPTGGVRAAGVTGAAGGNITASLALSGRAQADIRSEAQAGQNAMRTEVAQNSPQQLRLFNTELAKAQTYSTQIEGLTNRITLEQANLSAHEFSQTMFYLNRQLTDAKGLAGELNGPHNLGAMQRQSFMIGRQQTALGLNLQQRQITTQVALAGFQAPGESPEERYAKREEAMIRARTQQRQLGLSRQAFGVEGQIFNEQATRGVADTKRAIGITQEQRNVALDTAAANKAIDDAGRALAIHMGKAGVILDGAGQKVEAGLGAAIDFAAQYGGTMEAATTSLNAAMTQLADPQGGLNATIKRLLSQPQIPAGPAGSGTGRVGGGSYASGVLGMTSGPTHMYIGEAGRETVAVLRNPRLAQMGVTGGGGPNITIMVTGNTFSGPGDDQKLVQKIEAAVLSAMARKGQLLGLRGPSN